MRKATEKNNALLRQIANRGRSFYQEIVHNGEGCTIACSHRFSETTSVLGSSSIDDQQFTFDDEVVNAVAYRRVLARLQQARIADAQLDGRPKSSNLRSQSRAASITSVQSSAIESGSEEPDTSSAATPKQESTHPTAPVISAFSDLNEASSCRTY